MVEPVIVIGVGFFIIMCMMVKFTGINTIPDIEDYDNLYTLKCAQGGYLTKDNIVHIDKNGEERHLSDEEITRYFKK